MDQLRVNEWELRELNPSKQFLTDFVISGSDSVEKYPASQDVLEEIGDEGVKLLRIVLNIHGVRDARISKRELRVAKLATHSWEELTPEIRNAFRLAFGDNIKFTGENPLVLAWRRLKLELNS